MTEVKLCVCCEWCEHEEGACYSTMTGCDPDYYTCVKGHFYDEGNELDGWALRAMDCKDYDLSHNVQAELKRRDSK